MGRYFPMGVTFCEVTHNLGFVVVFSPHMMKLPPLSKVPPPYTKQYSGKDRQTQKNHEMLVWPDVFQKHGLGYSVRQKVLHTDGLLERLLDLSCLVSSLKKKCHR
jgi:hypothetical protein